MGLMERKAVLRITLGSLIFLIGICLLLLVFKFGFEMYQTEFVLSEGLKKENLLGELTSYGVTFIVKVIALFVMTVVSSCLSNKGISLIFKDK